MQQSPIELLPYVAYEHRITLPQTDNQTLLMRKKPDSFFAVDGADKIQFNPFTSEVITVEKFSDLPVASQIAKLIHLIFWAQSVFLPGHPKNIRENSAISQQCNKGIVHLANIAHYQQSPARLKNYRREC